ncbi:hypothetical protein K2173_014115 [Erythroxylum novogranatense]|uniref:Amino acid transporter transmembrane domain-containing protein n=1 Tax=Erythroxylum novogranatense TaxID=1862640 RepID=A0AAV8SDS3_9ROSI|nr:hypothetical protein K2173_014115 [Erythroxylum novogranatense]
MDMQEKNGNATDNVLKEPEGKLDAGAIFVLQSKGSWVHGGYHLTTSIVGPALMSLPYAFKFLGWAAGICFLVIGALVTFYSYNLLSMLLEHHAQLGRRQLRFRDLANQILGPRMGRFLVGPIQFMVCYGAVISCTLLGGQCMKTVYILSRPSGSLKLYVFVIIFGCLMLILAQIPSFHALRHINFISLLLCLAYSACATAGSIVIGHSSKEPKDYSVTGNTQDRVFGIFNATAIIATAYGNGIIPEIQATVAPPVKGKMFKGLCMCYIVLAITFLSVAISGYWAFGNISEGLILSNFVKDGVILVPKWIILLPNIFTILQLLTIAAIYLQPTNVVLEQGFGDPTSPQFSARNVIPRILTRSLSVVISTTTAAMFPFFGDINSLIGAFGFVPLDIILPVVFYNLTFKKSKSSLIFWLNVIIAITFAAVGVLAAIAAVRQISLDAQTYQLFANV